MHHEPSEENELHDAENIKQCLLRTYFKMDRKYNEYHIKLITKCNKFDHNELINAIDKIFSYALTKAINTSIFMDFMFTNTQTYTYFNMTHDKLIIILRKDKNILCM